MSMISSLGRINSLRNTAAKVGAKYLKVVPTTTKVVQGAVVKTNHKTGTQVVKYGDGVKSIVLGAGNQLSKLFGKGAGIVSYPKGHVFGGETGRIVLSKKGAVGFMHFTPKEFGEFINMMKDLAKIR